MYHLEWSKNVLLIIFSQRKSRNIFNDQCGYTVIGITVTPIGAWFKKKRVVHKSIQEFFFGLIQCSFGFIIFEFCEARDPTGLIQNIFNGNVTAMRIISWNVFPDITF